MFRPDLFIGAQAVAFDDAMAEIRSGRKTGHWVWFVFPQLKGLGHSAMSELFGLDSLEDAREYLAEPVLGPRYEEAVQAIREACEVFHALPRVILGDVDAEKLRSSLTLFAMADDRFEPTLRALFSSADTATWNRLEATA